MRLAAFAAVLLMASSAFAAAATATPTPLGVCVEDPSLGSCILALLTPSAMPTATNPPTPTPFVFEGDIIEALLSTPTPSATAVGGPPTATPTPSVTSTMATTTPTEEALPEEQSGRNTPTSTPPVGTSPTETVLPLDIQFNPAKTFTPTITPTRTPTETPLPLVCCECGDSSCPAPSGMDCPEGCTPILDAICGVVE